MTKPNTTCHCTFEKHTYTTIQRIAFFKGEKCEYRGRCRVVRNDGHAVNMCRTHAKLAVRGFVDAEGYVTDKNSRADYQAGKVSWITPHAGVWTCAEFPDEAAEYEAELRRRYQGFQRARRLARRR